MKSQRICLILVNLLLLSVATFFFSSCNTFKNAHRKYATDVIDTTFQTVRQVVPHDSVSFRIVTDTTTITKEVRQGRARIIYQRDGQTTYVRADCDSVIVDKKVPVYITKQVWGIDPVYKERLQRWKTTALILIGLIGVGIMVYVFTYKLKLNTGISIQKRS